MAHAVEGEKVWLGSVSVCDVCKTVLGSAFVDGRISGRTCWAIMCPPCHAEIGVGLGTGRGQFYVRAGKDEAGRDKWIKRGG